MSNQEITNRIEEYMSSVVRERGYYNMLTAVSYAGDKNETFNREGTIAKNWRSDVYVKLFEIFAEVEQGKYEMPSIDKTIEMLPKINW